MVRQLAFAAALALAGCGYENRGSGSNTVPSSPFGGTNYAGGPNGGSFNPNSGIQNAYDFATAYCATPLYKCQRWKANREQYAHYLSPDPSCAPGWPWSGQPRAAGFICGVPLPNTGPLYHWYNPTLEASIYNTRSTAEDPILVQLGYQVQGYLGFVPLQ